MDESPSYDQLAQVFLKCARAVIARVRDLMSSEEVPGSFKVNIRFRDSGFSEHVEEQTRYRILLKMHYEDIFATLGEMEECVNAHLDAGLPIWTRQSEEDPEAFQDRKRSHLEMWLRALIGSAMDSKGSADLADDEISEAYRNFHAWLNRDETRYTITVPLVNTNVSVEVDHADVALSLRPLDLDEKTAVWNAAPMIEDIFDTWDFESARAQLGRSFSLSRGERYDETKTLQEIETWITALRLLKHGNVGVISLFTEERPGFLGRNADVGWATLDHRLGAERHGEKYELDSPDVENLRTILSKLNAFEGHKAHDSLRVALRWFNGSYVRRAREDRIIDFAIALESTLLADIQQELTYRLAIRGAALLADTRDPKEVYNLLRAMYEVRSKIVHEGKSLVDNDVVKRIGKAYSGKNQGFEPACEELVREVLRTYVLKLTPGQSVKTLNKRIDEHVLDRFAEQESTSG